MSESISNHFKVNLVLSDFISGKCNGKAKQVEEIMRTVCALLNTEGGQVDLNMDNDFPKETIHDLIREIEQRFEIVIGALKTSERIQVLTVTTQKVSLKILPIRDYFCTLNYNLFLPCTTKTIAQSVEPKERRTIETVIEGKRCCHHIATELGSHCKEFTKNQHLREDFLQSHNVLCKPIKNMKKDITSHKFQRQVSALANDSGGHIYHGISINGNVDGVEVNKDYITEITSDFEKAVMAMIWGRDVEPIRGREWEIYFAPVKDENNVVMKRVYVIVVSIAPFKGGVFTAVPKCYHIVGDSVKQMDNQTWRDELLRRRTSRQCKRVDEHVRSINVSEFSSDCISVVSAGRPQAEVPLE